MGRSSRRRCCSRHRSCRASSARAARSDLLLSQRASSSPRTAGSTSQPRRGGMVVAVQFTTVLVVGAPLMAVTQPFMPPFVGLALFASSLLVMAFSVWRTANDLQGRCAPRPKWSLTRSAGTRARTCPGGAETALRARPRAAARARRADARAAREASQGGGQKLTELEAARPHRRDGDRDPRGDDVVLVPDGHEALRLGDVLALAGTSDAIEGARAARTRRARLIRGQARFARDRLERATIKGEELISIFARRAAQRNREPGADRVFHSGSMRARDPTIDFTRARRAGKIVSRRDSPRALEPTSFRIRLTREGRPPDGRPRSFADTLRDDRPSRPARRRTGTCEAPAHHRRLPPLPGPALQRAARRRDAISAASTCCCWGPRGAARRTSCARSPRRACRRHGRRDVARRIGLRRRSRG